MDGAMEGAIGERHPRLVELVEAELRRLIVSGHWPQGHRLVEGQVAAELGVSRNPVREAMRSLEAEGLVELQPRKGARVAMLPAREAADLFDVRSALEELAAALAAQRRTPVVVEGLQSLVAAGEAAVASGRIQDLPPLNTRFHALMLEAAGNAQLTAVMRPLRDRIEWVYASRVHERAPASWAEHAAMAEAIAAGDHELAGDLAQTHILRAKKAFLAGVADQKPLTDPPSTRTTEPVT